MKGLIKEALSNLRKLQTLEKALLKHYGGKMINLGANVYVTKSFRVLEEDGRICVWLIYRDESYFGRGGIPYKDVEGQIQKFVGNVEVGFIPERLFEAKVMIPYNTARRLSVILKGQKLNGKGVTFEITKVRSEFASIRFDVYLTEVKPFDPQYPTLMAWESELKTIFKRTILLEPIINK